MIRQTGDDGFVLFATAAKCQGHSADMCSGQEAFQSMTPHLRILATRAFLILSCAGLISCSSFEQTRDRGSLMKFETAAVPRDYHGLWAKSSRSCRAVNGNKAQLYIMPQAIGRGAVQNVGGYSDYADVVVELVSSDTVAQRGDTLFMQLSLNGNKVHVSQSGDRNERIYHRCAAN